MPIIELCFGGLELTVDFSYQPEEAMTPEYPGCEEAADIESVKCGEIDLTDLLSDLECNYSALECAVLEKYIEDSRGEER